MLVRLGFALRGPALAAHVVGRQDPVGYQIERRVGIPSFVGPDLRRQRA